MSQEQAKKMLTDLKQRDVTHPLLQRLKRSVSSEKVGIAITSYDRMHHRHNRS